MNAGRIAIGGDVLIENLPTEGALPEGVTEYRFRSAEQIALGQELFLRQQNPGPVGSSKARIGPGPRFENWNHIENSKALHRIRVVQSQTIGNSPATIVADQCEGRKPE